MPELGIHPVIIVVSESVEDGPSVQGLYFDASEGGIVGWRSGLGEELGVDLLGFRVSFAVLVEN